MLKNILEHATKHRYGIPAVNTFNFESIKWIIKAAEIEKVPIIVQFYPGYNNFINQEFIAHMATSLAKDATCPVAVHLDHATQYDTAVKGIKDGFSSIMVDGSVLPFEENIKLTSAVVRTARVFGTEVEAELGHVGSGQNINDITNADKYTDINEAQQFVKATDCDILAIAVGNAHGPYIQKPNLDFDRIKAIRKVVDIPLVLHGSSDIPDEQIQEAVNQGISKFNIATEYFRAYYNALDNRLKNNSDAFSLTRDLEEPIIDFLRKKIALLNPKRICTI